MDLWWCIVFFFNNIFGLKLFISCERFWIWKITTAPQNLKGTQLVLSWEDGRSSTGNSFEVSYPFSSSCMWGPLFFPQSWQPNQQPGKGVSNHTKKLSTWWVYGNDLHYFIFMYVKGLSLMSQTLFLLAPPYSH